uniref:Hds1 n=1 Tax=Arundo donax TaxID=35708 RepID=A0A0A9EXC8_ARUDO
MVSKPVLELLTTSALPLEEPDALRVPVPGTDKTFAKSTLLVKPIPPSRTLTCGRGAGATPVAMAVCKQQELT